MTIKPELQYSKDHEWVKEEDGLFVIGISDFAQDALGDLVFVNLPEVGDAVTAGEAFGDVESVKAVSDLLSPVSGTVAEINEELLDAPEKLNEDPYGAWIIKVSDVSATEELLDAAAYEAFCAEA
ncbi:MAG: glycine cleavage system protein GcvH [Clostridia bacterium]|jgi:glycine cleavage system H protein|nr:glycine cleavage system protein GcvH [Clostridia bacterium]MBQ5992169.1 glycine cleavage system protein GcvH [Clostridia bacterium]MDO4836656.1 glycine cleavage system protein GcvH [Clostridia bacterium]